MNDPVMLIFPRVEVESLNTAPLLRRFAPEKLPRGRELAAMMSTFHFAVHGFDDDPHEVCAIELVRRYYQERAGEPVVQVEIDPRALLEFISLGWEPMNAMCERAGMSERANYDRSKAIMEYYGLPFDVPPPR